MIKWELRSKILSNLLNPAFCGEVLKRFIQGYNQNSSINTPFPLVLLILPIILNKDTRDALPSSTRGHLFTWVDNNEHLFMNFSLKVKEMLPYTREAIMFLKLHNILDFDSTGNLYLNKVGRKLFKGEEDVSEINSILMKSEMLGKWLSNTDVKSVYSFFRIVP